MFSFVCENFSLPVSRSETQVTYFNLGIRDSGDYFFIIFAVVLFELGT
jgi:hypothetical protein